MSIKGGEAQRLMEKSILNFHFDYLTTSLTKTRQDQAPPSHVHDKF